MIHAATGLSTRSAAEDAAAEAGERALAEMGVDRPDWCVAFVSAEHGANVGDLVSTLSKITGTPYIVGCSAAGVLAQGREIEAGPCVGVLTVASDQIRATPFLFLDDGDHGLTVGVRLGQRMASSKNSRDLLLVWPDPYHIRPDRLLHGLDAALGTVPVAGAAASAALGSEGTFQFSGAESGRAAVSGLRLGGDFRHHVAITQGCRPLGRPLTVTRAHENLILEVEGRPALEMLRERAPGGSLESADEPLFVGILQDGGADDYLVRSIVAADPDTGVLALAETVEEGQRIVFAVREGRFAREDLKRVLWGAREALAGDGLPRFGLYFNCLARGRSLYREDGVDAALLGQTFPGVPILGLFGNAEIAPLGGLNRILTYTGVLLLVCE
jgi:small ligand-binding sensory domain FIST